MVRDTAKITVNVQNPPKSLKKQSGCCCGTTEPGSALVGGLFPASVLGKAFGLYNSTCFIGAILSPFLTGWVRDVTGSFAAGLYGAAALSVISVVTALGIRPAFRLKGVPPVVAAPRRP